MPVSRRHKILFVYPCFPMSFWSFGYIKQIGGFTAVMPPLGLAILAALTPPEFDVEIVDENIEAIDFDAECDVVALSAMAIQEARLFEVADAFRRRGRLVCMGGPICNVLPERCRPHCDVLFEGEGEYIWKQFLADWREGTHRDHYVQADKIDMRDSPAPRVELLKVDRYRLGCVQTTRGCPFKCEFCDIIVTYGRKVRAKPVAHVIAELQQWADHGVDFVTLADDNLVGDRAYCRQMLRAVADWNRARAVPISLFAEMSVDAVRDPELLELCRQANITEMFLGVETPRKAGLRETLKMQNVATDLVSAVKTIQSYGMVTVAGMIIGFDSDDAAIFEDQYAFLQEAGIPIVMLGLLQAIPRTPLYERLERTGRLRSPAQGNNTLSFTNIEPVCMRYDELVDGYRTLFTRLYTLDAIGDRWLANVDAWRSVPGRTWLQKPLGRWRPFMLVQTLLILRWYVARPSRFAFFCRMMAGTLARLPAAVPQTFSYLAYFIHLREYADKVVAREWKFNYALDEVNTAANRFGEGGAINMVKLETTDARLKRLRTNHVQRRNRRTRREKMLKVFLRVLRVLRSTSYFFTLLSRARDRAAASGTRPERRCRGDDRECRRTAFEDVRSSLSNCSYKTSRRAASNGPASRGSRGHPSRSRAARHDPAASAASTHRRPRWTPSPSSETPTSSSATSAHPRRPCPSAETSHRRARGIP